MSKLSRFAAKTTHLALKNFTNCSSLPGKVAYKINNNSLSDLEIEDSVIIFIMGTNGKSTITNYLYYILQDLTNKNIISNIAGANMYQGVLTCLLLNQKGGRIKNSIILLEVDELTMPRLIADALVPDYILINNLFDDQVDRYSSKEELALKLKNTLISKAVLDSKKTINLLINRDDPTLLPFYELEAEGLNLLTFSVQPEFVDYNNVIIKDDLAFDYINYGNIGRFNKIISNGYMRTSFLTVYKGDINNINPNISFELVSDQLENIDFSFDSMCFLLNQGKNSIFNIYNITASLSLLFSLINNGELGAEVSFNLQKINSNFNNISVDGRMEKFNLKNGTVAFLNLVKNEVGTTLTINEYEKMLSTNKCDLVINFGNTYADGVDLSWVRDVDFSKLNSDNLKNIYVIGEKANDIISNIKSNKTFVDFVKIRALKSLKDINTRNNLLVLSNFSKLKSSLKYLRKNSYEL